VTTAELDARRSRTGSHRTLTVLVAAGTLGYLSWLVIAHHTEIDRALVRIQGARARWLVAAVALEVLSQGCAVLVQHRLLRRAGSTIRLGTTSRIVLAQNAIGLALPGGPALASIFFYRQIRRRGSGVAAAGWVVAATGVVSTLALGTWGIFTATGASWFTIVAGTLLVIALYVLVTLARAPARLRTPTVALEHLVDRVRRRRPDRSAEVRADERLSRFGTVRLGTRDWAMVALFALTVVAADCAVWFCAGQAIIAKPARCGQANVSARVVRQCENFHPASTSAMLITYSAGQAALFVPVLPSGVGLVESVMTATLTTTKVRPIQALSAVLLYRIVSVGSVVVVGGVLWLTTRRRSRAPAAT
jgi:uncharacterized membrane protein YbhN (UPF0104 family)